MKNRAFVLISGYNARALISFCRVLTHQQLPFFIIARDSKDPIFLTNYSKNVIATRTNKALELVEFDSILNQIKIETLYSELVLFPSTEALNRFFLANRIYFETLNCIIPLVDIKTYEQISDKFKFSELCEKEGILVPPRIKLLENISLPAVIKPKTYENSNGQIFAPIILRNPEDIQKYQNHINSKDFYAQEYIEGTSYYLLYYFAQNGTVLSKSQRNLLQQGQGKSIILAEPAEIHLDEISSKFINLFKKMKFTGLVMVEVRKRGTKYYMIEANPRPWGPSQFLVDIQSNFFETFLIDCGFSIDLNYLNNVNISSIKYFWFGGIQEGFQKYGGVTYLEYSSEQLVNDLGTLMKNDIYLRPDTLQVFLNEVENYSKSINGETP